jgi:hypothetical protein
MSDSKEVEEDLALDLRVYGVCFWKVVDGQKVRVHPRDVRRDVKDRVWRDSTSTQVEYNSVPARLSDPTTEHHQEKS